MSGRGKHMDAYWCAFRQGRADALFDGVFESNTLAYIRRQAEFYNLSPQEEKAYKSGVKSVVVLYSKLARDGKLLER